MFLYKQEDGLIDVAEFKEITVIQLLNQPIINTIVMGFLVLLGYALTSLRIKRAERLTNSESIAEAFDEKVDKEDCKRFKTRIGKQVDEQHESLEQIRRALIFIVTEMGGKPAELGLFGK